MSNILNKKVDNVQGQNDSQNKAIPLDWGIRREGDGRFVLYDTNTENVLDDAQGHGFETYYKAYNYGYNKYHTKGVCNGKPNEDYYNYCCPIKIGID